MATEDATADPHFRVRDEISLPEGDEVVWASATREDSYPIHVTRDLAGAVELLATIVGSKRLAIITDERVDELHGAALRAALDDAGLQHASFLVPPGEPSKCHERADEMIDWLADGDVSRDDFILTFGGGVINDTGGYVAAEFMRGLRYINLPTTLLAQVDGALGGKVAVNHRTAKNLRGAFHQPAAVISNVGFLETLDRRNLAAGLAESIKKAIIASPAYWELIDGRADELISGDLDALEDLVRGAAKIKTILVERDPYERDLRRPLNFGHTVGHPIETLAGYGTLLHGEAVAFGMVVETRIASNRGLLSEPLDEWLPELLGRVDLPRHGDQLPATVDLEGLKTAMAPVYRIRARSFLYVLPERRGVTVIAGDVEPEELRQALNESGVR